MKRKKQKLLVVVYKNNFSQKIEIAKMLSCIEICQERSNPWF